MARQVLENGVVLPAEYSDDWYDDMTSNLTKLDDVIGSDSEKLSSADVGAAALSNNYNDLDNLPTIPTVNDATLTIQKNGVDVQTFTANASSNVTANINVPTSTSDLINDSNFVDTSNSAVASGITSAKVTSYDSHVADTDIHVTTADKSKWNNNVTQSYVFRYSSTVLVASSTNSNTLLDNTDNLKVGDKVIDSNGVLFSITAIDTANSTFTVGSALIDLALDANVVHTSGNETVGGKKELSEITTFAGSYLGNEGSNNARTCMYSYCNRDTKNYSGIYQRRVRQNREQGSMSGSDISQYAFDVLENQVRTNNVLYFVARDFVDDVPQTLYLTSQCTNRTLGSSNYAWSAVYSNAYYYGNIEFSDKFVTTDTDQNITGLKSFIGLRTEFKRSNGDGVALFSNGSFTKGSAPNSLVNICRKYYGDATSIGSALGYSSVSVDNNGNKTTYQFYCIDNTAGSTSRTTIQMNYDKSLSGTDAQYINISGSLLPSTNNSYSLGNSTNKWATINGLNPSALSMPDLNNGVDISSYITVNGGNKESFYTPTVNGWISVALTRAGGTSMAVMLKQGSFASSGHNIAQENGTTTCNAMLPVKGGVQVSINSALADGIDFAYFYPCQGNV